MQITYNGRESYITVSLLLQLKYNTLHIFFDKMLKKFFNKFYNYS